MIPGPVYSNDEKRLTSVCAFCRDSEETREALGDVAVLESRELFRGGWSVAAPEGFEEAAAQQSAARHRAVPRL